MSISLTLIVITHFYDDAQPKYLFWFITSSFLTRIPENSNLVIVKKFRKLTFGSMW